MHFLILMEPPISFLQRHDMFCPLRPTKHMKEKCSVLQAELSAASCEAWAVTTVRCNAFWSDT